MGLLQSRRVFLTGMAAGVAFPACGGLDRASPQASSPRPTGRVSSGPRPQKGSAMQQPIPTRDLGSTGERVSILGLGGYHIGSPEERVAIRIMHEAIDAGSRATCTQTFT